MQTILPGYGNSHIPGVWVWITTLLNYERKQAHKPRMLDGGSESALILGSDAGPLVAYNLAVRIQKFL